MNEVSLQPSKFSPTASNLKTVLCGWYRGYIHARAILGQFPRSMLTAATSPSSCATEVACDWDR